MSKTTWEKEWLDAEKSDFRIVQVYPDGDRRIVSKNQDTFTAWAKDNTPKEVDYVPPPPVVDNRTVEEKRRDALMLEFGSETILHAVIKGGADLDAIKAELTSIEGTITE